MIRRFPLGLPGLLLPAVLLALLVPAAPRAQLMSLETEDMRLIYVDPLHSYIAPYVGRCFTTSLRFHRNQRDYDPSEKVTVILADLTDYGNAGAGAVPRNGLVFHLAPINNAYETISANERINTLMNHEVLHVVALDQATGADGFFRKVFGGKVKPEAKHPESLIYSYLTTPRQAAPRWFHEGNAVFMETWMAGGLGRALGAYDEMVFRAMVRDSSRFYDPLGLESEGKFVDFQGGVNAYLYGTRFVTYVAGRWSPEDVVRWSSHVEGTPGGYGASFRRVFGVSLDDAWRDWIAFEHRFQRTNLDSIRQYPVTPLHPLSDEALGSVSRTYFDPDTREIYAAVFRPGDLPEVVAIDADTGKLRGLKEVQGAALYFVTSLAYDPTDKQLFYTIDNGDWRDLCRLDPATGDHEVLQEDLRVGDLAFNRADSSLWGIRHYNGYATFVRIPPPYDDWFSVMSWPYGQVPYDLDVSPDGRTLVCSLGEINGRQTLISMDTDSLRAGVQDYETLHDFGNSNPANFVFTPDGRYLYGSSYYTGVSNIWRYDTVRDTMNCMTNAETGLFRPMPVTADSLLVFDYTGDGFTPAGVRVEPLEDVAPIEYLGMRVVDEHPVVRGWMAEPPSSIDLDSLTVSHGKYNPFSHLGLTTWMPIVEGYVDFDPVGGTTTLYGSPGVAFTISDVLTMHKLEASVSYTPTGNLPDDERLHVDARYSRNQWALRFTLNRADFYDLFGPTTTSRKGISLGIDHDRTLFENGPRKMDLRFGVTGFADLEQLPYAQEIGADDDKMVLTYGRLGYRNWRFSMGAVEYEKGFGWDVNFGLNYALEQFFLLPFANLNAGVPFLVDHSSLWIWASGGHSILDEDDPTAPTSSFSKFFLGGFGNNYVDRGSIKRYREWYAFPGADISSIGGQNFAKGLLEWNLPPLRFSGVGKPSFYASWLRLSLFGGGVVTDLDADAERFYAGNAGAQMDLRLMMFSNLRLTVSLGYAMAFPEDEKPVDEVMVSLKIL